jgi:O-antigen/teichoic acid export membrane protein
MLNTVFNGGFGFIFWMMAAKYYTPEDVGVATAIISSLTLITVLSKMGFDISIIRYYPQSKTNNFLFTTFLISSLSSIILGVIFILGSDYWSPELSFLKSQESILFIFYVCIFSVISLAGVVFVARNKPIYYFIQSLVLGSRIPLLFLFMTLGFWGIINSFGLSLLLTLLITGLVFYREKIDIPMNFNKSFLKYSFTYSAGNYLVNLLTLLPNYLLPLVVINLLGSTKTAQFYIVFSFVSILYTIPSAVGTSLLVEGSNNNYSYTALKKSFLGTYGILFPLIIILIIFGNQFLSLIGKEYSSNIIFFNSMVVSSILVSVVLIYISHLRILKDIKGIIKISSIIFFSLMILSVIFLPIFDLLGVAFAWIVSYTMGIIYIIFHKNYPNPEDM